MKFEKVGRGSYRFVVDGVPYVADKNDAGFAHRNWDLWNGATGRLVADQLESRAACVRFVMHAKARREALAAWRPK
jgi:hypothetical protein